MGALSFRNLALFAALLWLLTLPPLPRVAPLEVEAPIRPQPHVYYFPIIARAGTPLAPVSQKRGVALTHSQCADEFGAWGYDYSGRPPACAMETVPMAWSGLPGKLGGNSAWLMGFNEPDRPDQSNLSPERAAELWVQIETLYPDRLLVSPAPSHLDPAWIVRFREAYVQQFKRPPRLDALATHCYLPTASQCEALIQQFEVWARAWGVKQVWLTEFNCSTLGNARTEEQAWAECKKLMDFMDDDDMVGRYAYFAARVYGDEIWAFPVGFNASLLDKNGKDTFWGGKYKAGK